MDKSSSSMISLKAELFRKQEEVRANKTSTGGKSISAKPTQKKLSVFDVKNRGVNERAARDAEETALEKDTAEKTSANLARKAEIYQRLQDGEALDDSGAPLPYLVDFEQKAINQAAQLKSERLQQQASAVEQAQNVCLNDIPAPEPSDGQEKESVQLLTSATGPAKSKRVDSCSLERTPATKHKEKSPPRMVPVQTEDKEPAEIRSSKPDLESDDMHRERMRQKWEQEEAELAAHKSQEVHYSNVQFDEARMHGAGFYKFDKDVDVRRQQMEQLNSIRDQSEKQRRRVQEMRHKKQQGLAARLEKVRQRKGIHQSAVPDLDIEFKEPEVQKPELLVRDETARRDYPTREWDRDKKDLEMLWHEKKEKLREEREPEFAPPSTYYEPSERKKPRVTGREPREAVASDPMCVPQYSRSQPGAAEQLRYTNSRTES